MKLRNLDLLLAIASTLCAQGVVLAAIGDSGPAPDSRGAAELLGITASITTTPAMARTPIKLRNGGTIGPRTAPATCQTPVGRSSLGGQQVQRLGTHVVGETVPFTVPPHTGTISVIEQAVGTVPAAILVGQPPTFPFPNAAVPTLLIEPNGTLLYDDNAIPPSDPTKAHVAAYPNAVTGVMTLPTTTQAFVDSAGSGYPMGVWSLQVNDYAYECVSLPSFCSGGSTTDLYDLTVITKPVARLQGELDVSIYLATQSLTAKAAVASPNMARFANTLAGMYAQIGIHLDDITVYDLPLWAKIRYATGVDAADTAPCSYFGQLLSLSVRGNGLDLFFVETIRDSSSGSSGAVVGIDPSIPGPASIAGTIASGVVVNSSDLAAGTCGATVDLANCGADEVAYVAAHEGGHFMGLHHTSEAFGDTFDPLGETPVCTCSACLDATHAAQCASYQWAKGGATCSQSTASPCGGGNNLMFWQLDSRYSTGSLVPEQGKVMRASPAVRQGE